MTSKNLQAAIDAADSAVEVVRNATAHPFTFPTQAEFTNWRSEQAAWRDTIALLDLSHRMTDLVDSLPATRPARPIRRRSAWTSPSVSRPAERMSAASEVCEAFNLAQGPERPYVGT